MSREQLKGFSLLTQECSPHTNIPTAQELSAPLTGDSGYRSVFGGREELHSGGGSDAKIAFDVYFNFTEC